MKRVFLLLKEEFLPILLPCFFLAKKKHGYKYVILLSLGVHTVAKKLREDQETHIGDRIYKNLHSQLLLAAENEKLEVGA